MLLLRVRVTLPVPSLRRSTPPPPLHRSRPPPLRRSGTALPGACWARALTLIMHHAIPETAVGLIEAKADRRP